MKSIINNLMKCYTLENQHLKLLNKRNNRIQFIKTMENRNH